MAGGVWNWGRCSTQNDVLKREHDDDDDDDDWPVNLGVAYFQETLFSSMWKLPNTKHIDILI